MTTQPQPEPSEVSAISLPVVCWQHRKRGKSWGPAVVGDFIMEGFERRALTPLPEAQYQLAALRSEVARLTGERDAAQSSLRHANAMREENADSIAILRAQVDALAVDAGRYRYLLSEAVNQASFEDGVVVLVSPYFGDDWQEQTGIAIDAAIARTKPTCRKCGAPMAPGIALQQTFTGSGDFGRDDVVTLSPGGQGKIVPCEKCTACGWSVLISDAGE